MSDTVTIGHTGYELSLERVFIGGTDAVVLRIQGHRARQPLVYQALSIQQAETTYEILGRLLGCRHSVPQSEECKACEE